MRMPRSGIWEPISNDFLVGKSIRKESMNEGRKVEAQDPEAIWIEETGMAELSRRDFWKWVIVWMLDDKAVGRKRKCLAEDGGVVCSYDEFARDSGVPVSAWILQLIMVDLYQFIF